MVEGVAQEVDVASLEGGLGEDLADGRAQSGMIVGEDELDAMHASPAQVEEEVLPGRTALAMGHFDGKDLAASVPVDADGDQHRLAHDDAALAHLLITRVEDEGRKGLGEGARGKGFEAFVQALVDGGDGGGGEGAGRTAPR